MKAAVEQVREEYAFSRAAGVRFAAMAVSSYRYQTRRSDEALRTRLVELAREKPRFGYRRLHVLLQPSGRAVNHKRVHRVYREAGLSIRRKKRKHCVRVGQPLRVLDGGEPGVGAGLRARCGGVRAGDPGAERGGCLHAGVSGAGSGHQLCQPASDAGVGRDHRRARAAAGDSLRQRAGTDEPAFSGVVPGAEDRVGAHPAGEADAERAGGELPRTVARRVSEGELVSESVRCEAEDRGWRTEYNEERPHSSLGYRTPTEFAAASNELWKRRGLAPAWKTPMTRFPLSHSSDDCCWCYKVQLTCRIYLVNGNRGQVSPRWTVVVFRIVFNTRQQCRTWPLWSRSMCMIYRWPKG